MKNTMKKGIKKNVNSTTKKKNVTKYLKKSLGMCLKKKWKKK